MIEALATFDRSLFLFINSLNATWLNPFMVFLSGQIVWVPLIVLIMWFAFKTLDRTSLWIFLLFIVLVIIASDVSSSYLTKNLVQRLRPCRLAELKPLINRFGQKCGGKFGFVSSHAANSLSILVFSFLALKPKNKVFHLLWLLPLVVSYSRIYLGVHYPGDILGGMIMGAFWAWLLSKIFASRRLRSKTA